MKAKLKKRQKDHFTDCRDEQTLNVSMWLNGCCLALRRAIFQISSSHFVKTLRACHHT